MSEVDRVIEAIGKDLRGEPNTLGKQGEETAALVRKTLEREMLSYIGQYKEQMTRTRDALVKLAEDLPKPEPKPAGQDGGAAPDGGAPPAPPPPEPEG